MEETIFRAYDIRGTYGKNLFNETAYTIGKGFGSYIKKMNKKKVLVGYDNRLSSPTLAHNLMMGLVSTGVEVINIGLVTTPMFYFARYKLDIWSGIMLTASHNPKDDNGFKISFDERGNALGDEITEFKEFIKKGQFEIGSGSIKKVDIKNDYINLITNNIHLDKKLKVVFDGGNGTCGIVLEEILKKLNIEYDLLYCDSDGTFPNHHPDPADSKNLYDLQKRVVEKSYDLGIAFDADGDRVRLVDHEGNIINSDIFMIIVYRHLNQNLKVRKGLYDVKCSKALIDELNNLNIEGIMNRTGNSYQYRKMREFNLDFGGEYSGHMYFGDRFKVFDDGIYAGLRIVEILTKENKSLKELTKNIPIYYSTDEIKVMTTEENKKIIVEKIKQYCINANYQYNDIDGVRVEFSDGWALIRYSNTGAYITVRYEANKEERLEEIKKEFTEVINSYL